MPLRVCREATKRFTVKISEFLLCSRSPRESESEEPGFAVKEVEWSRIHPVRVCQNFTMGKRKSSAKPAPKRRQEKLATVFSCPFCNHDNSVECRMDRKVQIGVASCRICLAKYSTPIDSLSDPVDVYSDWIDECERINGGPEAS